nr:PREDICTED: REM2- and Rab-like small GTPase 1 [Bos mutus]
MRLERRPWAAGRGAGLQSELHLVPAGAADNFSSGDAACMASLCHGDCIEKCWLAPKKPQVGPLTPLGSRLASGLLERPVLPPPVAIDTASYKIFVSGKSGVGKTALVAKLAGLEVPVVHHETTGIQTTVVFWPAKLQASDRVVMFRFEFWDCGESALKKFEHMLPACKENADAFLFLFSFTDRASFEDLPGQLARVAGEAPGVVRMVIGSKFDQYVHTDVPEGLSRPRGGGLVSGHSPPAGDPEQDLGPALGQKCGFPPRTGHGASRSLGCLQEGEYNTVPPWLPAKPGLVDNVEPPARGLVLG